MFKHLFLILIVLLAATYSPAEEWRPLFNGKDLTGWTPKFRGEKVGVNYANTFRVEEGILKVRYDNYEGPLNGKLGGLFTDEVFSRYRVRVECRSVGDQVLGGPKWGMRNNGVLVHGQTAASMGLDQVFPVSLEAQAISGWDDGNPNPAGNLCTPGTNVLINGELYTPHCAKIEGETIKHGEWMTLEVEVNGGDVIRHYINGSLTIEYTEPALDDNDVDAKRLLNAGSPRKLTKGTISIQAESAPYDFRKIEILEFDK